MAVDSTKVFAPATIANLGPGFDVLGVAVDGLGDMVTATVSDTPGVRITHIEGDGGLLSMDVRENTAGIAASEVLSLLGVTDVGVTLTLEKGMPLGSGLGSSGASAAAAAWAVDSLFGRTLSKEQLLHACLVAESRVSGWHADNVAPSLFGGFILIRAYDPLDIIELPSPRELLFVLVTPEISLSTRKSREAVPTSVEIGKHIANNGNLAAMVAALFGDSVRLLGRSMLDAIVEPARAPLIPGFAQVKRAALEAGALACSIAGAGPTLFALAENETTALAIAQAMQAAFESDGAVRSHPHIARVDPLGARVI
jgi:homoserine kinase